MRGLFIVICLLTFSGCSEKKSGADSPPAADSLEVRTEYTCPMHPEVVRDRPGECPECKMELHVRS